MPCIYYLSYPYAVDLLFKLSSMRGYLCYPRGVDLLSKLFGVAMLSKYCSNVLDMLFNLSHVLSSPNVVIVSELSQCYQLSESYQ